MESLSVTQSKSQDTAPAPQTSAAQTSVQPGTAPNLLDTTSAGVPIQASSAAPIVFDQTASISTARQDPPIAAGPNVALSAVIIIVFIVAAVLFYITSKPAKNTTE